MKQGLHGQCVPTEIDWRQVNFLRPMESLVWYQIAIVSSLYNVNQTLFLKKVVSIEIWWPLVYSSSCNIQANLPQLLSRNNISATFCISSLVPEKVSTICSFHQSNGINLIGREKAKWKYKIDWEYSMIIFNLVTTGFEAFPIMKSLDEWTGRLSEEVGLALHKETYSSV